MLPDKQAQGGTLTKLALSVGSALRSTSRHGSIGMIAGSLLEQIPTALDESSGVLDITGIDTVLYLDDSASMNGSNLNEGYKALSSLEERLKAHDDESRFLPTRIVKFGDHPQVLAPSDEHWSSMLVSACVGCFFWWNLHVENDSRRYQIEISTCRRKIESRCHYRRCRQHVSRKVRRCTRI